MKAPAFALPNQDGTTVTLDSLRGKKVVLYFYPKADTPGCTTQACGMRDNIGALKSAGAIVIGVSPDEVKDLKKFQQKYSLNFTLLADPSTATCQAYGVWQQKQFMGRNYMGVVRTTFLIDENGEITKRYDKVNPETHADMIIADIHGVKTTPTGAVAVSSIEVPKKGIARPVVSRKPNVKKPVKNPPKVTKKLLTRKPMKKAAAKTTVKKTVTKVVKKTAKKSAAKKKK